MNETAKVVTADEPAAETPVRRAVEGYFELLMAARRSLTTFRDVYSATRECLHPVLLAEMDACCGALGTALSKVCPR